MYLRGTPKQTLKVQKPGQKRVMANMKLFAGTVPAKKKILPTLIVWFWPRLAPPEVAFAMRSWPLLLPSFSLSLSLFFQSFSFSLLFFPPPFAFEIIPPPPPKNFGKPGRYIQFFLILIFYEKKNRFSVFFSSFPSFAFHPLRSTPEANL